MSNIKVLEDIILFIGNSAAFNVMDYRVTDCKEDILDYLKELKTKLEDEL